MPRGVTGGLREVGTVGKHVQALFGEILGNHAEIHSFLRIKVSWLSSLSPAVSGSSTVGWQRALSPVSARRPKPPLGTLPRLRMALQKKEKEVKARKKQLLAKKA